MKPIFAALIGLFMWPCISFGQSLELCTEDPVTPGELHIYAEPPISMLGENVEKFTDDPITFPGYRVQIFNGDRNQAEKIKTEVLQLYRDQPVYLSYEAPYFKVRVGDYRDKLSAQKMLHAMKQTYRGVLLVPDKINFPEVAK
jgi:hypothetical protein